MKLSKPIPKIHKKVFMKRTSMYIERRWWNTSSLSFFLSFSSPYFHETCIIIGMSVTSSSYNILLCLFPSFSTGWNFCIFEYERWMVCVYTRVCKGKCTWCIVGERSSLRARSLEFNDIRIEIRSWNTPFLRLLIFQQILCTKNLTIDYSSRAKSK